MTERVNCISGGRTAEQVSLHGSRYVRDAAEVRGYGNCLLMVILFEVTQVRL